MIPRTIITYLIDGNPSWIKTVEFSNRLIKWVSIPRKDFKDSLSRDELKFSGVYMLLWADEDNNDLAYIWQATVLSKRIWDHYKDTNKDFWNTAICFTYKDGSLTESDINFLEKQIILEARKINRYKIINSTSGNNWLIQEHRIPDMVEFIDDLKILLVNLWYSVLKEMVSKKELENQENIYYLTARWSEAKWIYTEEWFLILKNSKISIDNVNCLKQNDIIKRNNFIDQKCIEKDNKFYTKEDILVTTPSLASFLISWWWYNWWTAWKDIHGKTLDENIRQKN